MPTSARCSAITSGVAITSVDLQLDDAVLDGDREGLDRDVRGQCQWLSGAQVESRAVARALDGAALLVQLALDQLPVVVRAPVLDREERAGAVEDADLELLPLDEPVLARGQLLFGADVDDGAQIRPSE